MSTAFKEAIVREHFTVDLAITQDMVEKKTILPRGENCLRATHTMRLPRIHNAVCQIPPIDKDKWNDLLSSP